MYAVFILLIKIFYFLNKYEYFMNILFNGIYFCVLYWILLDWVRSEDCIGFTMICYLFFVSVNNISTRNHAPIKNDKRL